MNQQGSESCYELKLYVAGRTDRSLQTIANFRALCHEHLEGRHTAEIIDILTNPKRAKSDQILATPTLVKEAPGSVKKMVGTLSDIDCVLATLDLQQEGKCK